jgi:hypothetical protein
VFAPGAPINFTNAAYVRGRLNDAIGAMADPCRLVVIEASGVIYPNLRKVDPLLQANQ